LTDDEVERISQSYAAEGISIWFPKESDLEAYFCSPEFLQTFLGCTQEEAVEHLSAVTRRSSQPIRDQFDKQRAAHNQELHVQGGSPTNNDVWQAFQQRTLKGAKGKYIFKQLKNNISRSVYTEAKIQAYNLDGDIAVDLRVALERLLQA
jgi:hypothetical protein|tara:strand:+ start:1533 stop:1982 length:450 start_codon:yes stop_codon:yes gene_type:complete